MSDAYNTELRIVHDREVRVDWICDHDMGAPWREHDGHGPVRESKHEYGRGRHGDKKPGERPLGGESCYLYDWQAAMKLAKKDGWGYLNENELLSFFWIRRRAPTKGELAAIAVGRDFQRLRAWLNDEWHWCGIVVTDVETGLHDSLWGIESDGEDYHDEVIGELADNMWEDVLKALLHGELAA